MKNILRAFCRYCDVKRMGEESMRFSNKTAETRWIDHVEKMNRTKVIYSVVGKCDVI